MKLRYLPNAITLLRIILVWPFLAALIKGYYQVAFYIFLVAGLSDGIDGFLARRFDWTSDFGAFADPLADKLLIMSSFVALAFLAKLPVWIMILVMVRDVVIMAGVGGWFQLFGGLDFEPTLISKVNTALQVLLVISLLFELAYWPLPNFFVILVMSLMVITCLWSLFHYVFCYGYRAYQKNKQGSNSR